ncbi:thermonuclease family protein [bacterium]|nr:thermonuclease family protein [bacterium]
MTNLIFLLIFSSFFVGCSQENKASNTLNVSFENAEIVSVLSGDSFEVIYRGKKNILHLNGVNAPETKENAEAQQEADKIGKQIKTILLHGEKTNEFVNSLVKKGDKIKIEFDKLKENEFGELLAYVYLADGKMLNEEILAKGMADLYVIKANKKYHPKLVKAFQEARQKEIGNWKDF